MKIENSKKFKDHPPKKLHILEDSHYLKNHFEYKKVSKIIIGLNHILRCSFIKISPLKMTF